MTAENPELLKALPVYPDIERLRPVTSRTATYVE
jgi:hypothetical protein